MNLLQHILAKHRHMGESFMFIIRIFGLDKNLLKIDSASLITHQKAFKIPLLNYGSRMGLHVESATDNGG